MPPRRSAWRSQTVSACSSVPPAPAVALRPGPDGPSPWLHPHYRASQLLQDGPPLPPRPRYSAPRGLAARGFSLSRSDRPTSTVAARIAAPRRSFTRSTLAPEPGSRRLYAGCRLGSNQVAPKPVPRPLASSVSTSLGASRRVISGSLSFVFTGSHVTPFTGAFSATLTTPAVVPAQLAVVWSLLLIGDPGGPTPITNAAPCRVLHLHQSHLPGSRRTNCRQSALSRVPITAISRHLAHLRYSWGLAGDHTPTVLLTQAPLRSHLGAREIGRDECCHGDHAKHNRVGRVPAGGMSRQDVDDAEEVEHRENDAEDREGDQCDGQRCALRLHGRSG